MLAFCASVVHAGNPEDSGTADSAVLQPEGLDSASAYDATWSNTFYLGNMTENKWEELFQGPDFVDNYLVGYALTYDRPISERWSVGAELQFTYHFGDQDYGEIGLPLTMRYRPVEPWPKFFESVAFGVGLSYTTDESDVEIDNGNGEEVSQTLIYWMFETEFATNNPNRRWFVRIHHRSDGFETITPEGGSNALVLGIRQDF